MQLMSCSCLCNLQRILKTTSSQSREVLGFSRFLKTVLIFCLMCIFFMQDVPVDSGNECVPGMGGPVAHQVFSAASSTAAQIQSATALPSVLPCTASVASSNSTVPVFIPSSSGRETAPNHEQQVKEADLIRCIQAHLALLQSHEVMNGRTEQKCRHRCPAICNVSSNEEEDTAEEHSEDVVSEDDKLNVIDVAPVRDTSCKKSFVKQVLKSKKESPGETAHKVKTVKYLLGELRALITEQGEDISIEQ